MLAIVLDMIPVGGGMNAMHWLGTHIFQALMPGPAGSLLFALVFILICWSVGWPLGRRRIYIRV